MPAARVADSADCRTALAALDRQEGATAQARRQADAGVTRGAMARLQDRRQAVARDCLGGPAEAPPPHGMARDPLSVARPAPAAPNAAERSLSTLPIVPRAAASAAPPALPKRADPPVFVTGCDTGGCWASDGTRLPHSGAGVLSPQGPCTVLAGVLRCGAPR